MKTVKRESHERVELTRIFVYRFLSRSYANEFAVDFPFTVSSKTTLSRVINRETTDISEKVTRR